MRKSKYTVDEVKAMIEAFPEEALALAFEAASKAAKSKRSSARAQKTKSVLARLARPFTGAVSAVVFVAFKIRLRLAQMIAPKQPVGCC